MVGMGSKSLSLDRAPSQAADRVRLLLHPGRWTRGRGWSATAPVVSSPVGASSSMRTSGLRRFISKESTGARSSTRSTTGGLRVIPASAGLRP